MFPKQNTFRSEAWRRAVASLPCVCCMRDGPSQAAHLNHRGKGMGLKTHDVWTFPMCPDCHREYDQGTRWSKEDRRALGDTWVLLTVAELAKRGMVKA